MEAEKIKSEVKRVTETRMVVRVGYKKKDESQKGRVEAGLLDEEGMGNARGWPAECGF